MEGVLAGRDMLSFIDIAKTALERHPGVLNYINSWAGKAILAPLLAEEWFVEGHGIIGGRKDAIYPTMPRKEILTFGCPRPSYS